MPGYYDYYDEFNDLIDNQETIIKQNSVIISGDNSYHQLVNDKLEGLSFGLLIVSVWCFINFLMLCGNVITSILYRGGIFRA